MLSKLRDKFEQAVNWYVTVCDKRARKGRHSQNHIHLFYIDPNNYVGAQA
jgi:hypothetical protein